MAAHSHAGQQSTLNMLVFFFFFTTIDIVIWYYYPSFLKGKWFGILLQYVSRKINYFHEKVNISGMYVKIERIFRAKNCTQLMRNFLMRKYKQLKKIWKQLKQIK